MAFQLTHARRKGKSAGRVMLQKTRGEHTMENKAQEDRYFGGEKLERATEPLTKSGRGQPHSKTCRRIRAADKCAKRLGVRLPSAAFDCLLQDEPVPCHVFQDNGITDHSPSLRISDRLFLPLRIWTVIPFLKSAFLNASRNSFGFETGCLFTDVMMSPALMPFRAADVP